MGSPFPTLGVKHKTMKLTKIKDASELETLLTSALPLQISTLKDVQTFFHVQELKCSEPLDKALISDSHISHLIKAKYDLVIRCLIPIKGTSALSLFNSKLFWDIRFLFENSQLVQIIITRVEQNPL